MMKQRSEEWMEARKGLVTGSSVGAILGLDPNRDRDDVMREMVRAYHGAEREFHGNIATQWGITHEEEAREDFSFHAMLDVSEASFVVHPTEVWIGASPDGYVGDDALLEIKCPFGIRSKPQPEFKTAGEQKHYLAQMQVQMFVTERKKVYFWQWTPYGHSLEVVDYDPKVIADILPKLKVFYDSYLIEIESPEAYIDDARLVDNSPEGAQLIAEYDDTLMAIAEYEERKKDLLAKLVVITGGRDAVISGRKLTQVSRAGSISYAKAIKELAPGANLEKWRGNPTSYWTLK